MDLLLNTRSSEPELMDDLACDGPVVNQTLREIDFINQSLGGNALSLRALEQVLRKFDRRSLKIVDIGCGSGDLLARFSDRCEKSSREMTGTGIDANPYIITHARDHCKSYANLDFKALDVFSEAFKEIHCDVMHASLFLHHFTKEQLIELFGKVKTQAKYFIINDLHRHPLAYWSIKGLTALLSKSEMVRYDACLSVKRGFQRKEWEEIFVAAGVHQYQISWKWAFRWQIIIDFNPHRNG